MPIVLLFRPSPPGPWARLIEEQSVKDSVDRWVKNDGEFRQYISRRYEVLKLIGAGNLAGLVAIGAFLHSKDLQTAYWVQFAAKTCWFGFGVGFLTFCISYWLLYRWEMMIDYTLLIRRKEENVTWEDRRLLNLLRNACEASQVAGYLVANSIVCFGLGMLIIFFGVLLRKIG